MWERPAVPAFPKERYEGWDSFTVPRFARFRHFHGASGLFRTTRCFATPLNREV